MSLPRPRARVRRVVAAPTLGLLLLAGCGGHEGLAPVNGTVRYKGEPLTSGEVRFVPEGTGARGALGPIDAQGHYELSTFDPGDGAYVGSYRVTVVAVGPDKPIPAKRKGKMMQEEMQGSGDPLVPKRYFSPTTTDLKAEVVSGKTNVIDLDLKD